jgi:cyclic di-GMP phosphodiesterase
MEQQSGVLDASPNTKADRVTELLEQLPALVGGVETTDVDAAESRAEILPKVMIVDDEPVNVKVVAKHLRTAGFTRVMDCCEPARALDRIIDWQPDVLILDILMPGITGLEILQQLRNIEMTKYLPVIVLTASSDQETKLEALNLGASDFLSKPVDPLELAPRIRNSIQSKRYQDHLRTYSDRLEAAVARKTAELELSRREVLLCLARAAEYRDDDTGQHIIRVGRYAAIIAHGLGRDADYVHQIEQAAQLHDVGKIGIRDEILHKPGKLNNVEYNEIQKHSGYGKHILQTLASHHLNWNEEHSKIGGMILQTSQSPLLQMACRIALTHHERWDGSGYPIGLATTDIPLEGRITAVADVFDALSSRRPYKPAYPLDKCLKILEEGRGTHFDPEVLDAFFRMREKILDVQMEFLDVE